MPVHHGLVQCEPVFLTPQQLVLRGGFIGTSRRGRDRVPLITGFSINMGVRDPMTAIGITPCVFREASNGHTEES